MATFFFNVDDRIRKEIELIQEEEGLGNRTATVTFLVKYYFLTKKSSLDHSIALLDKLLAKMDTSKLPSLEDQLKDV